MLLMGLLLAAAQPALGQRAEQLLQDIQSAYEQLELARVEEMAQEALTRYQRFRPEQLVRLHTLLGIVNYTQNDTSAAGAHFRAALSLHPELTLDPRLVSPKIREAFASVKQDWRRAPRQTLQPAAEVRYLVLHDPRPAAAWRSMVLPGWGHLYLQQPTKGWLLVGMWTGSLSGAWLADRFAIAEEQASAWPQVRSGFLVAAAAPWIYSYVGVVHVWQPAPLQVEVGGLALNEIGVRETPAVHLRLRF